MDYDKIGTTPMMKQWVQMKKELGEDVILFCRVGDFYELFYEDAVVGSKELDIVLTSRSLGDGDHPLAGVPFRSVDSYIGRLVNKGYKVAIADQLEDPKSVKGVVKRGITRVVTRGTLVEEELLTSGKNNYICSLSWNSTTKEIGVSLADLSCGEFMVKNLEENDFENLHTIIDRYSPVEYLVPDSLENSLKLLLGRKLDENETLTLRADFWFNYTEANELLTTHFQVKSLEGYGIKVDSEVVGSSGALLRYLEETQMRELSNISKIQLIKPEVHMNLNRTAIKSLELFENNQDKTEYGTLVGLLDKTCTPMGGRRLRKWIHSPLLNSKEIETRHLLVEFFIKEEIIQHKTRNLLTHMADIERISTRISLGIAKPKELIQLSMSLSRTPELLEILESHSTTYKCLDNYLPKFDTCLDIQTMIEKYLVNNPASSPSEGRVINQNINDRLASLVQVLSEGEKWIERYKESQIEQTGITSLKIKQNRQLGYYIEVTRKNENNVPSNYIRRQAMVNAVRFVTDELKDWENDILNAEIEIIQLEEELYNNLLSSLSKHVSRLQELSSIISELDVLSTFSYISLTNAYVKPELSNKTEVYIEQGRHPIIETFLDGGRYVPNDIFMDKKSQTLLIITGPNFSGKSSLLRMLALISILSQIGMFVPAKKARLGIFDRIFTRIGASDNLIAGQSTFLVEMLDVANMVNNCTSQSLIIADEIGRGTSTYDGLAIAWSLAEFLHNHQNRPLTMIATHYHQLADLEGYLDRCMNFHFQIHFDGEKPIFDHLLFKGSSDKSFGVEVAKLAGIPKEIILRARFLLHQMENQSVSVIPTEKSESFASQVIRVSEEQEKQGSLVDFFGGSSLGRPLVEKKRVSKHKKDVLLRSPEELEILATLSHLSLDNITPLKALEILNDLKSLLGETPNGK